MQRKPSGIMQGKANLRMRSLRSIYIRRLSRKVNVAGQTKNISKPTEYAIINAEKAIEQKESELLDILAVEKTLLICDENVKKVIECVYFVDADKDIEKGDICDRVHQAEMHIHASERQIYYWLNCARKTFAVERKLRL